MRLRLCDAHTRRPVRALSLLACTLFIMLACGCSRNFWRNQADLDAYTILKAKTLNPMWDVPRTDVTPPPASRLYDPYNPDCPPLPPDDPAANIYMHWLDGRSGYKCWWTFGETLTVENPLWLEHFGLTPEMLASHDDSLPTRIPQLQDLTLSDAIELAALNSREYQTQIENVFLSALALTFERFQFNVRYLGLAGQEPGANLGFENVPGEQNSLGLDSRFGVSQLLPSGGQWIVELANNTLWLFSGPDQTVTASTLSYSLVQPLLLGAGRKVVLEALTQTERAVLYQVRDLARFRKVFFVDIVASNSGFLALLQQWQTIDNELNNIRALREQIEQQRYLLARGAERVVVQLAALPEDFVFPPSIAGQIDFDPAHKLLTWRGPMSDEQAQTIAELHADSEFQIAANELVQLVLAPAEPLDVLQLESRLANSESRYLQLQTAYMDTLDRFKFLLGLPPNLDMSINHSLLEPFELINPDLTAVEERIELFVAEWAALTEVEDPDIASMREVTEGLIRLREELRLNGLDSVEQDFRRVEENLPRRLEQVPTNERRQALRDELQTDVRLYTYIRQDFERLGQELQNLRELLADDTLEVRLKQQQIDRMATLREALLKIAQSLPVIQVDLRVELIALPYFDLSQPEAVQIGLDNRLDLMNARARVMDARRQMEVAANRLEAVLDVVVEGDLGTAPGTRPFDFRGDRSSLRAGLRFTAPLDQIAERNNYRRSLIEYQRARRDYMEFEDSVKLDIRDSWRQLTLLKQNFEIARRAVRIAARQLDSTIEEAAAPVPPGQTRQLGSRGLNLLNAFDAVLDAQNDLIGTWVDYERNRLNIYRDMGIMVIDDRGLWTDAYYQQRLGAGPTGVVRLPEPSDDPTFPTAHLADPRPKNESGLTGHAIVGSELVPIGGSE